jgi:hypothetical protein
LIAVLARANADIRAAAVHGSAAAMAAKCQRQLQAYVANWPSLFPAKPFDATLLSAVAHANAFGAPSMDAERLRVANRASLWGFSVDWQIDYLATSLQAVDDIVQRCMAVAAGDSPADGDALAEALAAIRDDLASRDAFPALRGIWRTELQRMLAAMALEWRWREAAKRGADMPSLDDYVDNADNLGSSFVDLSHWIYTGEDCSAADVADVTLACRQTQKALRLINDLGTYDRDSSWGDLNALKLGVSMDEVTSRIAGLITQCQKVTAALRSRQPALATFLDRQIGFCVGFYQVGDFWGER